MHVATIIVEELFLQPVRLLAEVSKRFLTLTLLNGDQQHLGSLNKVSHIFSLAARLLIRHLS